MAKFGNPSGRGASFKERGPSGSSKGPSDGGKSFSPSPSIALPSHDRKPVRPLKSPDPDDYEDGTDDPRYRAANGAVGRKRTEALGGAEKAERVFQQFKEFNGRANIYAERHGLFHVGKPSTGYRTASAAANAAAVWNRDQRGNHAIVAPRHPYESDGLPYEVRYYRKKR